MNFWHAVAAVTVVLTLVGAADADPALDGYVREVLVRQPALKAGALRRDALQSEAEAAGVWPDPSFSVMGDYLPGSGAQASGQMPMVSYRLEQMVPWPGKLSLMRAAGERSAEAADADVERRRIELTLEAKRAYYMLILNGRRREINRAARGLAAFIVSASISRYGSGLGGHHEVARAEVEVRALDVELEGLNGERKAMVAMLNALRDRPPEFPFEEPKALEFTPARSFTSDALITTALKQRPELRGMDAMKQEAITMASLSRKEALPDFMVGGWFNQMIMGPPHSFGIMFGGTIPIFGVTRASRRATAYEDRAAAVGKDVASMTAMIKAEVVGALSRFDTVSRQVDLLANMALPKARESLEASIAGYSTGGVEVVGVMEARRALQTLDLLLAQMRIERELALAALERACGGKLPEGEP